MFPKLEKKKKIQWKCQYYGETRVTRNANPWVHLNCWEIFPPSSESFTFKICHFGKKAINGIALISQSMFETHKHEAW